MDSRPGRPFGLTIAIVASVLLFTFPPLAEATLLLSLQRHFRNVNISTAEDLPPDEQFIVGGDFLGVEPEEIYFRLGLGLVFLVVCIFAWRGKPPVMRFVLLGAVIFMTVVNAWTVIANRLDRPTIQDGIDSGGGNGSVVQLLLALLVAVYVMWYINRAPSRAFFRGYYLTEETATDEV